MKMRANGWGGYLLRVALAAVAFAVLCRLGMWLWPSQCLRLALISLFAFAVACGAFLPKGGLVTFRRRKQGAVAVEPAEGPVAEQVEKSGEDGQRVLSSSPEDIDNLLCPPPPYLSPASTTPSDPETEPLSGEELYAQARALPHGEIPDFETDWMYLELLGRAAQAGYPRAMAKLGDYAMRRWAWVEAYYWMWRAQRSGMCDLAPFLREIRRNWAATGYSDQASNVHELFGDEAGSVGRALLDIDSGRDAAAAREYLRTHFPEYLEQG